MERLEETHPGAKDELMKIGILVRRNDTGIGQAVGLAGEQSYLRSAKTAGGLTHFQTKAATSGYFAGHIKQNLQRLGRQLPT